MSEGVVRWGLAREALALLALDPCGLGGVSVRAAAGPIRDRWLALLRGSVPGVHRMPSTVGDENLLGGLDLAATLDAGRPVMRAGLLAGAHGGVVLLPMAERIDAATAAKLCMVMDRGAVSLQRDGLAGDLPARFGLVALDESASDDEAVPAALRDRLAFHLDLDGLALADAPADPLEDAAIAMARVRLAAVSEPPDALEAICAAAFRLGIDSVRACLLALRAARACCALDGRTTVDEGDLLRAAALVLAPRATVLPAPDSPPLSDEDEPAPPETETEQTLADIVLDAARAALPPALLASLSVAAAARQARGAGRAGAARTGGARGRPIGTRRGDPCGGARLHLLETLKAAAPWQRLREIPPGGRIAVRREDFRIVRSRHRTRTTTIFAVDASGSAALHRLAEAKGAVELLLADCYVRRDEVALVGFRRDTAEILLPPTGSLLRAKRCLAGLPGGGATPLAAGLDAACAIGLGERRKGRTPVIALLTDGRANVARDGRGDRDAAEADALGSARSVQGAAIAAIVIDTAPRPNPFLRRIADAMHARYIALPHADASSLTRAVRTASE